MSSTIRSAIRAAFLSLSGGPIEGTSKSRRRKVRPLRTRRPEIEVLERRIALVVNAAASFPATIGPGAGFDGVVQVLNPGGGLCSGTLIADGVETGRHILTAAHCVDFDVDTSNPLDGVNDRGNGTVDAGNHTVVFNMPGRNISLTVPAANITVHNQWTGFGNTGSDIALIRLPELAPFGAEKRFPYRDTDEDETFFGFLGYGGTNRTNATANAVCPGVAGTICSGNFGTTSDRPNPLPGSFGTKRWGFNRVDSTPRQPAGSTNPFDDYLRFDLDNPNSTTDPGVGGEALSAPGDSGGPLLIGGMIAGVSSTSTQPSVFGGTANYTRVSSFAEWIDQTTAARYSLVLDMNNQLAGNDGGADRIELRTQNEFVQILVNGHLYHSDLATKIRGITIRGSNDAETITVTNTIQRSLTLNSGGGDDTINIESLPRAIVATINTGAGADDVNFSPTLGNLGNIGSSVTIDGGSIFFEDDINFYDGGNSSRNRSYVLDRGSLVLPGRLATVNFLTVASIYLAAGSADDSKVDVWGTPVGSSTIVVDAEVVNVGKPQAFPFIGKSTSDVRGALSLFHLSGSVALTIDDTANFFSSAVDVTRSAVHGLTDDPIDFTFARLSSLTVNAGTGGNVFTVQDTRPSDSTGSVTLNTGSGADTVNIWRMQTPVTVNGQRGADTVNVGRNGNMQGVAATLTVTNLGNWSTLNLDDSADASPRSVTMNVAGSYGTVAGLAPGQIRYRKQDLKALNVFGGGGNNTFDVLATDQSTIAGGSPTTLKAGSGFDTINVVGTLGALFIDPQNNFNTITIGGRPGSAGSLGGILGEITLRGEEGVHGNFVDIIDRGNMRPSTYTMDSRRLYRTIPATGAVTANIEYGDLPLDGLEIAAGHGGNRIDINGTPGANPAVVGGGVNVLTGNGGDSVTLFGSSGQLNVDLGGGVRQSIQIGDAAHSLDAVRGPVHVTGGGFIDAFISDAASTTMRRALIDSNAAGDEIVERFELDLLNGRHAKLNAFEFAFAGSGRVNYQTGRTDGSGNYNQVDVYGVPVNTEVVVSGGPDYDVFTVGFASDTRRTLGPVTIQSPQADIDFAYFYDYLNPNSQTYRFRTNPLDGSGVLVDRAGKAPIAFNGLTQLIYYSPLVGGNTTNVQSVPANLLLNMVVGDGDAVTFGSSAPGLGGTLANVAGPVYVASFGLDDVVTLILDDSGNTSTARDVQIVPHEFSGPWGLIYGLTGSSLLFRDYENWIVDIRGGRLDDSFLMSGNAYAANISIDGGGGNDILVGNGGNVLRGGLGRDLLIAGALAGILDGGADQDILIGGTLDDGSLANLDAIMARWTSAAAYDSRVADLLAGLLSVDRVNGNGGGNTLTGGSDALDLFFGSLVADWQAGERVVSL